MDILISAVARAEIFQGLSDTQMSALARAAERVVFSPGDVIILSDTACDAATLIVDGEAVAEAPDASARGEVYGAGSVVAEMAMVVEIEASSTIVAQSRVRALQFPRDTMLALIENDTTIADALIANITHRLHDVARNLRAIDDALAACETVETTPARVAAVPAPPVGRALEFTAAGDPATIAGITSNSPGALN